MTIEDSLSQFSDRIAKDALKAVAYHQLTPLSMMDENDCGISFSAATQHTHSQSHEYGELAVAYYKKCFPNLHPLTCSLKTHKTVSEALDESENVTLLSSFSPDHDTLIIPTFSPLNCVGIFALDIEKAKSESSTILNAANLAGRVLMLAQACHVEICKAQSDTNASVVNLTDREKEILQWVARGKSNSVIAQILGISMHTVSGYLRNIYLKTETNDRTSAAIFAMQEGLLHMSTASSDDAAVDIAV